MAECPAPRRVSRGPIGWMAGHSVTANLLMVVLLVGGLFWSTRIRQEVFPDFDLDMVTIPVPYPGASPQEVERGILLSTVPALMQRLPLSDYFFGHSFLLETGQTVVPENLRKRLQEAGYLSVSQVLCQGEYAVRGGVVDIFPMGCSDPFRLDLFGDQLETIRLFDPASQKSSATVLIDQLPVSVTRFKIVIVVINCPIQQEGCNI